MLLSPAGGDQRTREGLRSSKSAEQLHLARQRVTNRDQHTFPGVNVRAISLDSCSTVSV